MFSLERDISSDASGLKKEMKETDKEKSFSLLKKFY